MLDSASGALSMCNAIINGQCQVAQRTAPSVTAVGYQYGQVDRIACMVGATPSAGTISQVNSSNFASEYACRIAGVTMGAGGDVRFRYRIEARDSKRFINNTAIFSCIARQDSGSAINYSITINKANAADDFSAVTQIGQVTGVSVASGVNVPLSFSASMGNCSNGIEIIVVGACGAVTTKNFDLTDLQFELGSVQSSMERRPYGTEDALCKRYYQVYGPFSLEAYASGATVRALTQLVPLPVPMRSTPTKTIISNGTSNNVRSPATSYAGLAIVGTQGSTYVMASIEAGAAGLTQLFDRTEALSAEL